MLRCLLGPAYLNDAERLGKTRISEYIIYPQENAGVLVCLTAFSCIVLDLVLDLRNRENTVTIQGKFVHA
jgi:hypothetical protein